MKAFRLIFFLFFWAISTHAQNTVNTNAFAIDETNSLILINHNVEDFNTVFAGRTYINVNSEHTFYFTTSENVQVGKKYIVTYRGKQYTLYFTQLPIVKLTVEDEIVDSPNVAGVFELYAPGFAPVSSVMGVQFRGAASQSYPKKSMEIEFYTDESEEEERDLS